MHEAKARVVLVDHGMDVMGCPSCFNAGRPDVVQGGGRKCRTCGTVLYSTSDTDDSEPKQKKPDAPPQTVSIPSWVDELIEETRAG